MLQIIKMFFFISEDLGDSIGEEGMIAQLMDIREPLLTLRNDLQHRLETDLSEYSFWLQVSATFLCLLPNRWEGILDFSGFDQENLIGSLTKTNRKNYERGGSRSLFYFLQVYFLQ